MAAHRNIARLHLHLLALAALVIMALSQEPAADVGISVPAVDPERVATAVAVTLAAYPLARCLDGSPARYYIHGQDPSRFLIFHEGGGFCGLLGRGRGCHSATISTHTCRCFMARRGSL